MVFKGRKANLRKMNIFGMLHVGPRKVRKYKARFVAKGIFADLWTRLRQDIFAN